jgi:hypothetical protein
LLSTIVYGKDYDFSRKIAPFPEALFNPPKSSKVMIRFGMPKTDIDLLVHSWRAKLNDAGFKEVKKEPVQDKQFSISAWRPWLKGSSRISVVFGPGRAGMYIRYQADWNFIIDDRTGNLTEIRTASPWFKSKSLPKFNIDFLPKSAGTVSLPVNGAVSEHSSKPRLAPLRIVTSGEKVHYLVKLTDWNTDKLVQTIFVRAGHTAETTVPLGSCRLKYAAGETWLGENELFGEKTIFSKAEKRFDFIRKGNQVSGYSVELILQTGGNLSTVRIPRSEW